MKRGRSTCNPTKEESARIVAAKEGPCMACLSRAMRGDMEWSFIVHGCDYHHTKSGNIRRGHMAGFALCTWHHRGHPAMFWSHDRTRQVYGPSLMDGSKLFRDAYGTDDELIVLQTAHVNLPRAA